MGRSINLEIKNCLAEFDRTAVLENINDWQGNETDIMNNKMLVKRNVTLNMVVPPLQNILQSLTQADQPWAEDHFQERISGEPTNPGETYKYWPYHKNLHNDERYKDDQFSHTYQERYWPKKAGDILENSYGHKGIRYDYGDLSDVVKLLKKNSTTRQAYLPIWFPEDTWAANNQERVPCSLGYYFYYEYGRLHCNYIIRSCDLFRHFRNDIYLTGRLLQHVATLLDTIPGDLNMHIFNLHLFQNDLYPFKQKERKLENGTNNT